MGPVQRVGCSSSELARPETHPALCVRLQVAAEDEATAHAAVQSIDDKVLKTHAPL